MSLHTLTLSNTELQSLIKQAYKLDKTAEIKFTYTTSVDGMPVVDSVVITSDTEFDRPLSVDDQLDDLCTFIKQNPDQFQYQLSDAFVDQLIADQAEISVQAAWQTRYNGGSIEVVVYNTDDADDEFLTLIEPFVNHVCGEMVEHLKGLILIPTLGLNPPQNLIDAILARKVTLSFIKDEDVNTIFSDYSAHLERVLHGTDQLVYTYPVEYDHSSS
jgi:hypothetical protein